VWLVTCGGARTRPAQTVRSAPGPALLLLLLPWLLMLLLPVAVACCLLLPLSLHAPTGSLVLASCSGEW
jgi:hypothetical protein